MELKSEGNSKRSSRISLEYFVRNFSREDHSLGNVIKKLFRGRRRAKWPELCRIFLRWNVFLVFLDVRRQNLCQRFCFIRRSSCSRENLEGSWLRLVGWHWMMNNVQRYSYYFSWEWTLNSCFLVFQRAERTDTSKNPSVPLAEAMPFCSGFVPFSQGSMKGLEKKRV